MAGMAALDSLAFTANMSESSLAAKGYGAADAMDEAKPVQQEEEGREAAAPVSAAIAFSGIEPEPALVRGLSAASVVTDPGQATHLVMGGDPTDQSSSGGRTTRKSKSMEGAPGTQVELKRTPKLLTALNLGVQNVVVLQWLIDSADAGYALPLSASEAIASTARKSARSSRTTSKASAQQMTAAGTNSLLYTLQDAQKEREYGFSMLETLARQRPDQTSSSIFNGLAFYVTPDVLGVSAPSSDEFARIITSAGGLYLGDEVLSINNTTIPPEWVSAMQGHRSLVIVVLSTHDAMAREPHLPSWLSTAVDSSGSAALRSLAGQVLSMEFVYLSVLRQQLALQDAKRELVLRAIA